MDRRLMKVMGMSVVLALVVSGIFYQMAIRASGSTKRDNTQTRDLVVAAQPLPVGATVKPGQVKITKIPASMFPKGGFSKPEEVVDRPLISNILMDEAILEGRLAERGSGMGLAPIIPSGMRAVSVRVNDVVGVAGFVLPGMRVDILVTGRPPNYEGTVTTTVLQNIVVLTAGQTLQQEPRGQAINTPVVTLLVTPDQAEILTLAGNEGRIHLVLRNGVDQKVEITSGREVAELYGMHARRTQHKEPEAPSVPQARPKPAAEPRPPAPVPPAPPPPDEIIVIRGNQKTVEVIGANKGD